MKIYVDSVKYTGLRGSVSESI